MLLVFQRSSGVFMILVRISTILDGACSCFAFRVNFSCLHFSTVDQKLRILLFHLQQSSRKLVSEQNRYIITYLPILVSRG